MNRKTVFIVALFLMGIFGAILYFRTPKEQLQPTQPPAGENKEIKDPNKMYPQELFFLDRNYPDYNGAEGFYQQRMQQLIRHDKSHTSSHRGLDYPWTIQGPGNIGGRVNAIAVHPFNLNTILIGFSQGGIYKTTNGGANWKPVFDDQQSLSISHISFDNNNPDRVYAATGDVNISGYPFIGSGVYRSDDAGEHWFSSGLNNTGVLSKIVVDPHNSEILYAGSMGYPSHKGIERGVFRSVNQGQSWTQTLMIDDSTGIIDLVADPTQPGRVFASGWTRIRSSTRGTTVGPGTGIYRSDDYGANWIPLLSELPGGFHSRTGLEMANDGTLFVSYIGNPTEGECVGATEEITGIYKSNDAGQSWDTIYADPFTGVSCGLLGNFGWYFEALKVNPENSLDLFLLGVDMVRSPDGGNSWFEATPPWWEYAVHADKHDLVFAGGLMFLGTDGGAYRRPIDESQPWEDMENIPATQFYRTTFNPHLPDHYFGGAQDNGTTGGNQIIINDWTRIFGGDGFQPLFDPTEPDWTYAVTQNGRIWFSRDGGFNFDPLDNGLFGTSYWDMPIIMSSHNPKILFAGYSNVFRIDMTDTMPTWVPISADLTKGDTILGNRYPAITSLAQSDVDASRLYAGTQDGKLWTSGDAGLNWVDITEGTPGFYVTSITASPVDPQRVFATYSGYRDNDHTPYIYRSDNAGQTWTTIDANMPMAGVNSFLILPGWNDDVLFAATDGGVYVSRDAGSLWERMGTNFPYMPVYDLELNPVENTIVAATFSRGLMTFPVEELDLISAVDPVAGNPKAGDISIYPSVARDHVIIDYKQYADAQDNYSVALLDLKGQYYLQKTVFRNGKDRERIDMPSGLIPGIYYVVVDNNFKRFSKQILIVE